MMFIILNPEQADALRGAGTEGHVLYPIGLADGVTFVLPLAALTDKFYPSEIIELLAGLPTREIADNEWVPNIDVG